MVRKGEADAMICGTVGRYGEHLKDITDVIGLQDGIRSAAALSAMITPKGTFFICDPYVTTNPDVEDLVENTLQAAEQVRRFGITPKVAMLSHSNFGTFHDPEAEKMRKAVAEIRLREPDLEIEGEMHADSALDEEIRKLIYPNAQLEGTANLLMMPNISAANIALNMLKILGEGQSVGPLLLGVKKPAHIVTPSITVRGLVNVAALATVDAQVHIDHSGQAMLPKDLKSGGGSFAAAE